MGGGGSERVTILIDNTVYTGLSCPSTGARVV